MNRTSSSNRVVSERKRAIVVHEDPTTGYRLADRLAIYGYEAILARHIEDVRPHLPDIRPNVIVVDHHPAYKPGALACLRSVCPLVPIIAIMQPERSVTDAAVRSTDRPERLGAGVFLCNASGSRQQVSRPQ
ncbi:MAG TPA: hypothetical protein VHF07_08005 [Nitrospiraceae bacterium]|nr:hypothetical protein [Nitrospiraceae bacterium]